MTADTGPEQAHDMLQRVDAALALSKVAQEIAPDIGHDFGLTAEERLRARGWALVPVAEIKRLRRIETLHRPVPLMTRLPARVCADDGQVWPCHTALTAEQETPDDQ